MKSSREQKPCDGSAAKFYLATCCLVKDPALKQYAFGPCIGSKWRRQRSSQSQDFCGRRHPKTTQKFA